MARVHLLCGFNGAGKSTYARSLAADLPAVRLSQDAVVRAAHPDLDVGSDAHGRIAHRVRESLWAIAVQILDAGVDVILDWNQWSRDRRAHWRSAALSAGHEAVVHHLLTSLEVSVTRARARADRDPESHWLDEHDIRQLATLFEPPEDSEGLPILRIPSPQSEPDPS